MSVNDRRILVIRPTFTGGGEDAFVRQLQNAGVDVLRYPVMTITPFDSGLQAESIKTAVLNLDRYDTAVFISRTAALLGAEWLDRYWPQPPAHTQFFAVGKSTAEVLAKAGIGARCPVMEMTSEGLLRLPELQNMQHHKALIFRGQGGRETLAQTLCQRGADVRCVELYGRAVTCRYRSEINAALQAGVDAIAVHSGELLQGLLRNVEPERVSLLQTTPVLVPGERVAILARQAGLRQIIIADNALPENMVSALNGWYI